MVDSLSNCDTTACHRFICLIIPLQESYISAFLGFMGNPISDIILTVRFLEPSAVPITLSISVLTENK